MDKIPLNWGLMSNPFNWITILLMVTIGGMLAHIILPTFPSVTANKGS